MLSECTAGLVYVSAFPDFGEFRKHMKKHCLGNRSMAL